MPVYYAHRYSDERTYKVIHYYDGGSRFLSQDQHDYLEWVAAGNKPVIEAAGRFLSVVDGKLAVDPSKATILATEEAARLAEEKRIADKLKAITDNLPSWTQVDAAITAIGTLADAKVFIRKLARVVYWLAKDKAD